VRKKGLTALSAFSFAWIKNRCRQRRKGETYEHQKEHRLQHAAVAAMVNRYVTAIG
jgi:hypothetical protein